MDTPSFYSVLIPFVRYHKQLSWFDKILYSEISALTNSKGYCFANNSYFQDVFNVSRSTVQRSLNTLDKNGCIKIEIIKDKNNQVLTRKMYLIIDTPPGVKNDTTPGRKNDTTPGVKNDTYNIIKEFNNTSINKNKNNRRNNRPEKTDVNVSWFAEYLENKEA